MSYEFSDQYRYIDDRGVLRFVTNPIVRFLLDAGPFDMNALAMMDFPDEARAQFAQLIGYSVAGYGDLSYVSDMLYARACGDQDQGVNYAAGFLAACDLAKDAVTRAIEELTER